MVVFDSSSGRLSHYTFLSFFFWLNLFQLTPPSVGKFDSFPELESRINSLEVLDLLFIPKVSLKNAIANRVMKLPCISPLLRQRSTHSTYCAYFNYKMSLILPIRL